MNSQKKVKFLIFLAIVIVITLLVVITFQLVNIIKINNKIDSQNQQITQLEKELDYYKNKQPQTDYEIIL